MVRSIDVTFDDGSAVRFVREGDAWKAVGREKPKGGWKEWMERVDGASVAGRLVDWLLTGP